MLDALTRPQLLPFLNLSGSASLRETSAIQSREELFTPRRQGANEEAFQSKSTIPFLNLSGFAPLREHSPIQDREEFLTLRRQGAKKAYESESSVPSLNLSRFASLREPENCVERGLCRNAGEGAAGPSKSVLICGAARHFRFCLLSFYLRCQLLKLVRCPLTPVRLGP